MPDTKKTVDQLDKELQAVTLRLNNIGSSLESQQRLIQSTSDTLAALTDSIALLTDKVNLLSTPPPPRVEEKTIVNTNPSNTVAVNAATYDENFLRMAAMFQNIQAAAYPIRQVNTLRNETDVTQMSENLNFILNAYDLDMTNDVTTASVRNIVNQQGNNGNNQSSITDHR